MDGGILWVNSWYICFGGLEHTAAAVECHFLHPELWEARPVLHECSNFPRFSFWFSKFCQVRSDFSLLNLKCSLNCLDWKLREIKVFPYVVLSLGTVLIESWLLPPWFFLFPEMFSGLDLLVSVYTEISQHAIDLGQSRAQVSLADYVKTNVDITMTHS